MKFKTTHTTRIVLYREIYLTIFHTIDIGSTGIEVAISHDHLPRIAVRTKSDDGKLTIQCCVFNAIYYTINSREVV